MAFISCQRGSIPPMSRYLTEIYMNSILKDRHALCLWMFDTLQPEVKMEDTLISVATGLISALTLVMLFEIAILM